MREDIMESKKNFKINLILYFITLTTTTIVITSLLFAVYLTLNLKNLFGEYNNNIEIMENTIPIILSQVVESESATGNYAESIKIIDFLKSDNRLKYAYLKNNANDSIIFGIDDLAIARKADKLKVRVFTKEISNYTLYTGLPVSKMDTNIYSDFTKMIWQIIFSFIILAGIVSYMMASIITKPLSALSRAAKQITGGNFNIKIEETQFHEINDLIYSYNEMATQLSELYSSLELKVQERTLALEAANFKLKETQAMMVHSEKMRSLGALVAGIAHEINNPVNFIHGNIMILQNYVDDLFKLIDLYEQNNIPLPDDIKGKIDQLKKDIDLDFLRGDVQDLIKSCIEGTQRTKNIVLDLKNFSRMEEMVLTQFDIPKEIDTTLNILNNKYKNRITVVKNYEENLPKIEAYGGQLNQVFMNILDNAQDAMKETGTLTINVNHIADKVKIEFIDTGVGIPPENLKKVFDPFFTTKAVGKGTGLGMSISYRVIHDHHGTINVESEVGKGTKFTIVLPINYVENPEQGKENQVSGV